MAGDVSTGINGINASLSLVNCAQKRIKNKTMLSSMTHLIITFCVCLMMPHILLAITVTNATNVPTVNTIPDSLDDNCWISNDIYNCAIRATLYLTPPSAREANDFGLPLNIDCNVYNNATATSTATTAIYDGAFLKRATSNKQHIVLDGCHAPLSIDTYGLEYLDNCAQVHSLTIERFHGDATWGLNCGHADNVVDMQLVELYFWYNEVATIGVETFSNLSALQQVEFKANSLRYIECLGLDNNITLQRLAFIDEPLLVIKAANLFAQIQAGNLILIGLKRVATGIFQHLPAKLQELYVARTFIEDHAVILNAGVDLQNITLADCQLHSFTLQQLVASVRFLNLSRNALQECNILGHNTILEVLDLSANGLEHLLNFSTVQTLTNLRKLFLHTNRLKSISLNNLLHIVPAVQFIDLHGNQLTSLSNVEEVTECERTRIQIDQNPWNCMWLLHLAHTQPEKFRLFQYDKFISQLNVNGLACEPQEMQTTLAQSTSTSRSLPANSVNSNLKQQRQQQRQQQLNNSNTTSYMVVYSGPWELKRNQKSEALIIVFMLPLGIALLFLLLYMWIHCQKIFHLSYYRGIPRFGWGKQNSPANAQCFADRIDVVRYPTTLSNNSILINGDINNAIAEEVDDGYEQPINGATSLCNCQSINAAGNCHKLHHVTYEPLPTEPAYQVYAEIKEEPTYELTTARQDCDCKAPLYDHLSFAGNETNVPTSL